MVASPQKGRFRAAFVEKVSEKPFASAVQEACFALYRTDDGKYRRRLDRIADKLLEMAEEGNMEAIKEIGVRLDGRPPTIAINNTMNSVTVGSAIAELMERRKNGPLLELESMGQALTHDQESDDEYE